MQKITVIGLGKLGLCNALIYEKAGFNILGVDISDDYCQQLNKKERIFDEPQVNEYLAKSQNFKATTSLDEGLGHSDLIFIVVDTPNGTGDDHYDHSKLNSLLSAINEYQIAKKDLVICCTVMPGYIDNTAKKLITACEDVTISYNPEFIAQGEVIRTFENPDMVLIGEANRDVGDKIESIYKNVCSNSPLVCRMPPLEAEITKIAVNGFITMKLSYANMVGDLCDRIGADKFQVLESVGKDSRIGGKYLKPGYSFGGPCFPRDTKALSKVAEKHGIDPLMSEAAGDYNDLHNQYMVCDLLKSGCDAYTFEDVSFKENCAVPIIEESAKLKMAVILVKKHGKRVCIKDRRKVVELVKLEYGDLFDYQITD